VAQHLGDAVDQVRRKENKTLKAAGDDRLAGTPLRLAQESDIDGTEGPQGVRRTENSELKQRVPGAERDGHDSIQLRLRTSGEETLPLWHNWAVRSRLQPMIGVARMLKRRFENIITYLRHRITNAASESINAKVQWVKYTARGFRNRQNFVHAIYFHCGGLDMAPESTK